MQYVTGTENPPHNSWCTLNQVRTSHSRCADPLYKRAVVNSAECVRVADKQTVGHITFEGLSHNTTCIYSEAREPRNSTLILIPLIWCRNFIIYCYSCFYKFYFNTISGILFYFIYISVSPLYHWFTARNRRP